MKILGAIKQRIEDIAREVRIANLSVAVSRANSAERYFLWRELQDEINARSTQQVERMERAMGLRP